MKRALLVAAMLLLTLALVACGGEMGILQKRLATRSGSSFSTRVARPVRAA